MKNCERYKRWKKEQELLNDPKKQEIKKRKQEIIDCIEEEKKTVPKTITKIRYHKCKKEKKTKGVIFKPKLVSSIDLLLKRIQPSLEVRYKLVDHRHINCFIENVIALKETVMRQEILIAEKIIAKRDFEKKKVKRKKKISKKENMVNLKIENDENAATADLEKEDAIAEEITENGEKDDENKVQRNKTIKKDKFWCKKVEKKMESESKSESDVSECERLALTLEDKKKIEQNRRHVETLSNTHNQ
ncbi:hypothetical protein M0804_002217 [Polistes exclamans]|nr:hypothetical protein M0804_002217 [Polistes exclamans]